MILVYLVKIVGGKDDNQRGFGCTFLITVMSSALLVFYQYIAIGAVKLITDYKPNKDPHEHIWLEKIKDDYSIEEGKNYSILIPEDDQNYTYVLGKYVFMSADIKVKVITDPLEMDKLEAEYLINYDAGNEIIDKWIEKNYPRAADHTFIHCSAEE